MREEKTFSNLFRSPRSQLHILAALARDRRFLREMGGLLRPEHFDHELHSVAAEALLSIWRETRSLPTRQALLERTAGLLHQLLRLKNPDQQRRQILKPVEEMVAALYRLPLEGNDSLREQALQFCRRQEVKVALEDAQDLLANQADLAQVQSNLQRLWRSVAGREEDIIDFFPDTIDLPQRISRGELKRLPTGFPTLDRWMGGGMAPGTETVFMAPPKRGKSTLLINVALHSLLRRKAVVYFTHEISGHETDLRFTARVSDIPIVRIVKDSDCLELALRRRVRFWQLHRPRLIIREYPTKTASPESLRNCLYALEGDSEFRPDLMVVDYADIMRSTRYQGNGEQERFIQADVYEQLRALAQEFDCPLVTASQCNRASVSKSLIHMEDIAESYAKCAIADHIIAICQTPREEAKGELRLFYAGSRSGRTGRAVRCRRDWARFYVSEIGLAPAATLSGKEEE